MERLIRSAHTAAAEVKPRTVAGKAVEMAEDDVLTVLEADQLVGFKGRSRFGPRVLSPGLKGVLWGLRIYVVLMLVIVAIQVIRTVH